MASFGLLTVAFGGKEKSWCFFCLQLRWLSTSCHRSSLSTSRSNPMKLAENKHVSNTSILKYWYDHFLHLQHFLIIM